MAATYCARLPTGHRRRPILGDEQQVEESAAQGGDAGTLPGIGQHGAHSAQHAVGGFHKAAA